MTKLGACLVVLFAAGCGSDPAVGPKNASFATAAEAPPAACSIERRGETSLLICRTHDALLVASRKDGAPAMQVARVDLAR